MKKTCYANFQVHNLSLGYYYNRFTCFNAPKICQFSHTVRCPLCLKCHVLAPVSLRPPCPE